jgi:threonine synthase
MVALASATISALRDARALGWIHRLPRILAVQTRGGFPLKRAWDRLRDTTGAIWERLDHAASHRSQFMWPWETEPRSVAHGILDDETYDWLVIVGAMLETGGEPIVVDEATLEEANRRGRALGIAVDHTGSSGLAGLLAQPPATGERAGIIFSGGQH